MVDVDIESGVLHVRVHGMDRVLSLRSELSIPLAHVRGAEPASDEARKISHGIRVGTNVPGIVTAGTFHQDGRKAFWDVHDPDRAVAILLEHDDFDRLIVDSEDPNGLITEINDAVQSQRPRES